MSRESSVAIFPADSSIPRWQSSSSTASKSGTENAPGCNSRPSNCRTATFVSYKRRSTWQRGIIETCLRRQSIPNIRKEVFVRENCQSKSGRGLLAVTGNNMKAGCGNEHPVGAPPTGHEDLSPQGSFQTIRTGPGYCATTESPVRRVIPSTVAWATSRRSKGSLWIGGRLSMATT